MKRKVITIYVTRDNNDNLYYPYSLWVSKNVKFVSGENLWIAEESLEDSRLAMMASDKFRKLFGFELQPGDGPVKVHLTIEKED